MLLDNISRVKSSSLGHFDKSNLTATVVMIFLRCEGAPGVQGSRRWEPDVQRRRNDRQQGDLPAPGGRGARGGGLRDHTREEQQARLRRGQQGHVPEEERQDQPHGQQRDLLSRPDREPARVHEEGPPPRVCRCAEGARHDRDRHYRLSGIMVEATFLYRIKSRNLSLKRSLA